MAAVVPEAETRSEDRGSELYLFRFFKSRSSVGDQPQTVRISSPGEEQQDGGFVEQKRPPSYYFSEKPSDTRVHQLQQSAISGSDVIARSKLPCPGYALPWKVTMIKGSPEPNSSRPLGSVRAEIPNAERTKRKRLGKKHRIALRIKAAAAQEKQSQAEQERIEREAAEREKRTRRNREKKVKKKERDRQKKAAAQTQTQLQARDNTDDSD